MTVAELIAELQKHPQDMRVLVCGYEQGFDSVDVAIVVGTRLIDDVKRSDYAGRYDDLHGQEDAPDRALLLVDKDAAFNWQSADEGD